MGKGPSQPPMEYSCNYDQTLKPNVPFSTESPYFDEPMHPLILVTPGNYTISTVADFHESYDGSPRIFVWSKPIQFTVLPEKYAIAEINKLSPLQQYMAGIPATNIKCRDGLELLIKTKTGLPVCIKPNTATKLIERGLATKPNQVAINESPQITTVIMPSGFDNPSSYKTYEPSSVKVVIGINNTVRWINKASTADTLTSDGFKESNLSGEIFGGSTLSPGDTYEFTFTETGTFGYHGEPNSWQRGKVIVLQP